MDADTIRAKRLVLVDNEGRERIILDASWPNGFASIDLVSTSGSAWKIWADVDGIPKLAVQRDDTKYSVTFALDAKGNPVLTFYDEHGKPSIRLGTDKRDASISCVEVYRDGNVTWTSKNRGSLRKRK